MEPQTPEEKVVGETPLTKTEEKVASDISDFKTLAVIGYILPFLFFLPLLDEKSKNVAYVLFHANQQLVFLILIIGVGLLDSLVFASYFSDIWYYLDHLLSIVLMALGIIGIVNAYRGRMKELPFLGHLRLLK